MLKDVRKGATNNFFLLTGMLSALNLGGFSVSAQTKPQIRTQPLAPRSNVIYVNPNIGNDQTGKGTLQAPFRSITNALTQATSGTIIKLAPATYTVANGEVFPIQLKAGITIQGNESRLGNDTVIMGGGNFLSPTLTAKDITVLGADLAELRGVTVTNKNPRGYGLWLEGTSPRIISNTFTNSTQDGVVILGKSTALISKNIFTRNGANGMSIEGLAQPEINGNRFENTGYGIIIRRGAAPRIIANLLNNNRSGIIIQSSSSPILRGNVIERNRQTGITILPNSIPDLGSLGSSGNNIIRNNFSRDVQYRGTQAIAAVGNQILRISGNIQLSGTVQAITSPLNIPSPVSNLPNPRFPNNSVNPNAPIRTVIRNSVIVRSTLPLESSQPLPVNTTIDPNLPPVALTPPPRTPANRNRIIIISRAKPTAPESSPTAPILTPPLLGSSPIPLSSPTASLRYRVVVSANTESTKLEIRKLVPTAFKARSNGQEVIQVGVFSDRTAADEQVKKLAQSGFNAEIESVSSQ